MDCQLFLWEPIILSRYLGRSSLYAIGLRISGVGTKPSPTQSYLADTEWAVHESSGNCAADWNLQFVGNCVPAGIATFHATIHDSR